MKICGDGSYKIQLFDFQENPSQNANLYKNNEGKQISDHDHNVNTANTVSRELPEEFSHWPKKEVYMLQEAFFYL